MNEPHDIRLNLHYDLPEHEWKTITEIFKSMDGYIDGPGSAEDYTCWFGTEKDQRYITLSVEPSGFAFEARLEKQLWTGWITKLCAKLSLALGREVYDAEM